MATSSDFHMKNVCTFPTPGNPSLSARFSFFWLLTRPLNVCCLINVCGYISSFLVFCEFDRHDRKTRNCFAYIPQLSEGEPGEQSVGIKLVLALCLCELATRASRVILLC